MDRTIPLSHDNQIETRLEQIEVRIHLLLDGVRLV